MEKTNVMRLLEKAKIEFETAEYDYDENDLSGVHVAETIGLPCAQVFKTLVTCAKDGYFVFVIPVDKALELKLAAKAAGQKRIDMLLMKDLLKVTGYMRGGCSPIGMKKKYPTFLDESALEWDKIALSAGKRGRQIIVNPQSLADYVEAEFCRLTD